MDTVASTTTPDQKKQQRKSSSLVGAATAGTRAVASQLFTFYIRIPVKLFRPTRVDYLALPRAINPIYHQQPWNFFTHSGPALIAHAVKEHGWSFIPRNILPPLVANSGVGLVLYTSYLASLSMMKHDNGTYGLPETLLSGGIAGAFQSLAAAPIDAIVTRFNASEVIQSNHKSLWGYSHAKLREMGVRGVFSGFSVSFLKESLGFALFFGTFEAVKGAWYRNYVSWVYRDEMRPSRGVFPTFVILAGGLSTYSLQMVQYPLGKIQKMHLIRLEAIHELNHGHPSTWQVYLRAYKKTFRHIRYLVMKDCAGNWWRWFYGGFFKSTLMALPSTSIGLVVFEIMRLRYMVDEMPAFVEDEYYSSDF